jgi:hypothetical protein
MMTVVKRNKRARSDPELLKLADSLLANYKKPEGLIGENGLLKQLTKMLVERALEVEMTDHLGNDKSGSVSNDSANTRNGHSAKTLKGGISGRCPSTSHETAKARSSLKSSPSIRLDGAVSTTRSFRFTRAA